MFRKIIAGLLTALILAGALASVALADDPGKRVTIGANNSEAAIDKIYGYFRIERGSVPELIVTNEEERALLAGLVPESKIGTVALSSAYVEPRTSGGIEVESFNINYVTEDMYRAALQTAGITDARVVVAAATPVSGTGALAGIYKAYEDITGQALDENAKEVAAEELVLTGDLQDAIGDVSPEIIQDIKEKLAQTKTMTDDEIRQLIRDTAASYDTTLDEEWVEKILGLIKKMNELNIDPDTFLNLANATQGVQGFFAAVGNFFKGIGDFFVGLFTGFKSEPAASTVPAAASAAPAAATAVASSVAAPAASDAQAEASAAGEAQDADSAEAERGASEQPDEAESSSEVA